MTLQMRQSCLTTTSPNCPVFLLTMVNSRLSLDSYFVHRQSVIQHLSRWRALSVNRQTIQTLNSWPLCIAPAHSRVGEGMRLLRCNQIVWLQTTCERNAAEQRKPLKSVVRGCRTTVLFCIALLHAKHVLCAMHMLSISLL